MNAAHTGTQSLPQPSRPSRTLRDLLPLVIGLVALAVVEWFLVTEGWLLATWVLAAFLLIHGLIHFMFLAPRPDRGSDSTAYPFDPARTWLVMRLGLAAGAARGLAGVLATLVATGYLLASLATIGLVVQTDWWGTLVVGSSILSLVLLALMASPSLLLGLAVDLVLLWLVWSGAYSAVVT